jgi:predicted transcriptional regulator
MQEGYCEGMAEVKPPDMFVSTEEEVEVDAETASAIERGIRAAEKGDVVSSAEVRKLIPQWISKFSTPTPR